jgi:glycerol-3-phosphate cytidylyltransferase
VFPRRLLAHLVPGAVMTLDRAAEAAAAPVVGYVPGVFDLFHIGHVNILRRARLRCDRLVAGVVSDAVAFSMKGRYPAVPEQDRVSIVAACRYVDEVVLEHDVDKFTTWERIRFDVIYKGDDWRGTPKAPAARREHP